MSNQNRSDVPQNVSAAVTDLRCVLSDLSPTELGRAGLHRLGPCNSGQARLRVLRAIACLRTATLARNSWGSTAEAVCRVKTDAARPATRAQDIHDALKECQYQARGNDPFAPVNSIVMQHVKCAAESAGAQVVEGLPGDAMTVSAKTNAADGETAELVLTVFASLFLADFHFYPHDVTVRFRHLVGETEIPDEGIDADFVQLVRFQKYQALQDAFEILVQTENLDAKLKGQVQLKDSLRAFESTLLTMHTLEREAFPGCSREQLRDRGHGLFWRSASGLRFRIAEGVEGRVGVEPAYPARKIAHKFSTPAVNHESTKNEPPAVFKYSESDTVVEVPAQYVLVLDTPIIASTSLAQELLYLPASLQQVNSSSDGKEVTDGSMNGGLHVSKGQAAMASSLAGLQQLSTSGSGRGPAASDQVTRNGDNSNANSDKLAHTGTTDSNGTTTIADVSGYSKGEVLLEALLVPEIFDQPLEPLKRERNDAFEVNKLSGGEEIVARAPVSADKHLKFCYNRRDCSNGVLINRIPLAHPQQVHRAAMILRQQIAFNKLFQSCFSATNSVASSSEPELEQPIEVVVCDPPRFMHFGAYDSTDDSVLGVAVSIGIDGIIEAHIRGSGSAPYPCSTAKASKLFQASLNVPLALQAIRSVGLRAELTPMDFDIDFHP